MSETKEKLPAVFVHCVKTYEMMLKHKSSNTYEEKPVYRGHLTKDMEEHLGLTTAQYSRIMKMLSEMGCVYQLKRGAGRAPSEWVLANTPTYESFAYVKGKQLDRSHRIARAEDQRFSDIMAIITELSERLERVEGKVSKFNEIMVRLEKIESTVRKLDYVMSIEREPDG